MDTGLKDAPTAPPPLKQPDTLSIVQFENTLLRRRLLVQELTAHYSREYQTALNQATAALVAEQQALLSQMRHSAGADPEDAYDATMHIFVPRPVTPQK